MKGNCHVFADSHWEILPSLLLADCGYFGISQRLSYTLLAVPLTAFPTGNRQKHGNSNPFSLKGRVSVNIY
jgi:hypothetical protein